MQLSFKKIMQENLPNFAWLSNIVAPVNKAFEDIQRILNGSITFGDNMSGEIKNLVLDGTYPIFASWNKPAKPTSAWLTYCREMIGDHVPFTDAPFLDWEWDGGRIRVNGVTGITPTPSNKFLVTFIAVTG